MAVTVSVSCLSLPKEGSVCILGEVRNFFVSNNVSFLSIVTPVGNITNALPFFHIDVFRMSDPTQNSVTACRVLYSYLTCGNLSSKD